MNIQPVFCQTLADLDQVGAQLRLRLPAKQRALSQQIRSISQAQAQLERFEQRIEARFDRSGRPQIQQARHILLGLTAQMNQIANTLVLLAEEFPCDPEGTVDCLQGVNRESTDLLKQIRALQSTGWVHPLPLELKKILQQQTACTQPRIPYFDLVQAQARKTEFDLVSMGTASTIRSKKSQGGVLCWNLVHSF